MDPLENVNVLMDVELSVLFIHTLFIHKDNSKNFIL